MTISRLQITKLEDGTNSTGSSIGVNTQKSYEKRAFLNHTCTFRKRDLGVQEWLRVDGENNVYRFLYQKNFVGSVWKKKKKILRRVHNLAIATYDFSVGKKLEC